MHNSASASVHLDLVETPTIKVQISPRQFEEIWRRDETHWCLRKNQKSLSTVSCPLSYDIIRCATIHSEYLVRVRVSRLRVHVSGTCFFLCQVVRDVSYIMHDSLYFRTVLDLTFDPVVFTKQHALLFIPHVLYVVVFCFVLLFCFSVFFLFRSPRCGTRTSVCRRRRRAFKSDLNAGETGLTCMKAVYSHDGIPAAAAEQRLSSSCRVCVCVRVCVCAHLFNILFWQPPFCDRHFALNQVT